MDGSQSHQMLPSARGERAQDVSSGAPQSQVPSVSRRTAETWGLTALPCTEVPTPAQSVAFSQVLLSRSIVHLQILICRATQSLDRIVRHDDLCLAGVLGVGWLRSPLQSVCVLHVLWTMVWSSSDISPLRVQALLKWHVG